MNNDSTLKKEISFVLIMLILALCLAWFSFSYPLSSSVYPRALSVFLVILSFCQFGIVYFKRSKHKNEKNQNSQIRDFAASFISKKSITIYLLSGIYLFGINTLGFYISTYIYIAFISFYLGYKNKIAMFIWPIILCSLIWCVFSWFLHVPTPEGIFF